MHVIDSRRPNTTLTVGPCWPTEKNKMSDNRTAAQIQQEMERNLRLHDGIQACLTSAFIIAECLFLTNRLPAFKINNPIVLGGALITLKIMIAFYGRIALQNARPKSMMNLLPGGVLLGASMLIRGMCIPYFLIDVMTAFKERIESTQNSFLSFIDQQLIRIGNVVDFFNLSHNIFGPHPKRCVAEANWRTKIVKNYQDREIVVFDITDFNPKVAGARNEANEIQSQLKQNTQDWFTYPYHKHGQPMFGRMVVFLPAALILFDIVLSYFLKRSARISVDCSENGSASRLNNQTDTSLSGGTSDVPAEGSSDLLAEESSDVLATGSSGVLATGSSDVLATRSSNVSAIGSGNVLAIGSSDVLATGSSDVLATGSSDVLATGSSNLSAIGPSNVLATGSSDVLATGSSDVLAPGSRDVLATGSSDVLATGPMDRLVHEDVDGMTS